MTPPIRILPQSEADEELWRLTREVASLFSALPWVLIGGQMVAIIEAEHSGIVGRTTVDVDALLDVRTASGATLEGALRARTELLDRAHPAWRDISGAEDGIAALEILGE